MKSAAFSLHLPLVSLCLSLVSSDDPTLEDMQTNLHYAGMVYCSSEDIVNLTCGYHCDPVKDRITELAKYHVLGNNEVFVAYDKVDERFVVSFKGTEAKSVWNWVENLNFKKSYPLTQYPEAAVHSGFWNSWRRLKPKVLDAIANIQQIMLPAAECFESSKYHKPTNMAGQGRTRTANAEECQQRCSSVDGCCYFSWWPDGGCHLQDCAATLAHDNQGAKTGPASCKVFDTNKVLLVGHSLGGAMASNAAFDLKVNDGFDTAAMTFGAPRVGNRYYASLIAQEVGYHYRITHNDDPVPHVPMRAAGFWHASREIHFPEKDMANLSYKVCDDSGEDGSCADACSPYFSCTSHSDHGNYVGLYVYYCPSEEGALV